MPAMTRFANTVTAPLFAVAALTTLLTAPAFAASIETLAQGDWEGTVASDPQGPATTGSLHSSVSPGGQADAIQDVSGLAIVQASGFAANGQPGNTLLARSTWTQTFTNTTSVAQTYDALLNIPKITLGISKGFTGVPLPSQILQSFYNITLDVDGFNVFSSSALLRSGNPGAVLDVSGTDLGGVLDTGSFSPRYNFAPFTGTVNLGDLDVGASFTAVYRIEVGINIPGFEVSADAAIGDPLTVVGTSIDVTSSPAVVPVPAAAWLLSGALALLGGFRRARA
jgi:hypothetical protein